VAVGAAVASFAPKESVMRRQFACGLVAAGLLTSAGAQPFGWFPGSTVNPASETADRVVVVNLADGSIESDIPGNPNAPAWKYTDDFAGKDAFIPSFSPNGEFIYIINGGKGEIAEPDGHIRLYNAVDVIAAFRAGTTPDPDSWIQETVIPASGEDAVEPLCFTIDAADPEIGSRGYFIDASYKKLYTFDIETDSTLTQVNVVDSGENPSPFWMHPTQPFGFFCSFSAGGVPQVHVVDTADGPTAGTILKSFDLAIPAGGALGFEYASCALPMNVHEVQSNTLVPPSWPAANQFPANELWIYAGGIGLQGNVFGSSQRVSDPFNVYKLDIQPADPEVMSLTNGGAPEFTVTPSGFVAFPPFIQLNDNGNGVYGMIGGSTVVHPDGLTRDTLLQPSGSSNDNWFPIIGEMVHDRNEIYIGSASEVSTAAFTSRTYIPQHTNSKIYKYLFDDINKANVTLIEVANIDRSVSFVVGRTDTRVAIGASDTFLVDLTDVEQTPPSFRNTLCVLLDPADATPQDSLVTTDLGLIAGAYGQQPLIEIPSGGSPDFAIADTTGPAPVTSGQTITMPTVSAGTSSSRTFQVTNNGTATLNLDLTPPINGFTVGEGVATTLAPAASDTFTINAPSTPAGSYSTAISIATNDPDTANFSFNLEITVDDTLPGPGTGYSGDSNGSRTVNATDLTVVRNNLGTDYRGCASQCRGTGDANQTGTVNATDFTVVRNNLGQDYRDLPAFCTLTGPCNP